MLEINTLGTVGILFCNEVYYNEVSGYLKQYCEK